MIRPSPNEFERLKNEEFIKRRILRLKEVREHSKANASRLRHLYREQKTKVINKIAENIQEQINSEDSKTILDLQTKYDKQCDAVGSAHNNASDWTDPIISVREKAEVSQKLAQERHEIAVNQLKIDKEERDFVKNARLDAMNYAFAIERERAVAVASLPPPVDPFYNENVLRDMEDMTPRVRVCDRNKFSVIESYETCAYNVQRVDTEEQMFRYGTDNAMEAGERHQEVLGRIENSVQMESEEQDIKAQLRGHQAIRRQIVQKDYGELLTNLEHISKGEMAKRQREYHKNELVGPNSAGHLGLGHTAAMVGYKERCRERAVESAVMESLKDITNKSSLQQSSIVGDNNRTKLSKLYDIIKQQKENVSIEKERNQDGERMDDSGDNDVEVDDMAGSNKEEQVADSNDQELELTKDVLQSAAAAAIKSGSVLEKLNNEKERNIIERKIQYLDRRLENIREIESKSLDMSSGDSVKSAASKQSLYEMNVSSSSRSEGIIMAPSSQSVCSDSLNIIREFQRQALLKLSGRSSAGHSTNQIYTLERQFSDLSLESSSASEQFRINRLIDMSSTTCEASSASHSSVNEWVKTQLIQTIDRIPDWVTKGAPEQQFLPDLNMSFMSSILNIRSEPGSIKDDTLSSCSTVMTHSSVVRQTGRTSITEISNIDLASTPVKQRSGRSSIDPVSSQMNMSLSSVKLDESSRVQTFLNFNDPANESEKERTVEEDLIDFRSVEDLTASALVPSDEEISYMRALNQLMNIAGTSDFGSVTEINSSGSTSSITVQGSEFPSSNLFDLQDLNVNPGESRVATEPHRVDNTLINDYETFLSSLVKKPLTSPQSVLCTDSPRCAVVESDSEIPGLEERSRDTAANTEDLADHSTVTSGNNQRIYFTSTTREGDSDPRMTISLSAISPVGRQSGGPRLVSDLPVSDVRSRESMHQLSPYSSVTSDTVINNAQGRNLSVEDLSDWHGGEEENKRRRVKVLLSSTMKPNKQNVSILSPDVSSISSISAEACIRLKRRIMDEYFEKNRNLLTAQLASTKSSDLSMKPLESGDESTPRNPDSGKPSSRMTIEQSDPLNTGRLTIDDYFMTPRTDNNWTDYTPRDDWSSPHTQFGVLSEYVSSGERGGDSIFDDTVDKVDLDATLRNDDDGPGIAARVDSVNLIDFGTHNDMENESPMSNEDFGYDLTQDRAGSGCLSDQFDDSNLNNQQIEEENVPSQESSSACITSSFQRLDSYHSESPTNPLNSQEISQFEQSLPRFAPLLSDHSSESVSDADMSSLSLASFLKNESMCQQMSTAVRDLHKADNKGCKNIAIASRQIDSGDEMKIQLAQWKKDRLMRINKHPIEVGGNKSESVTKTEIIRKHDDIEKRSRTLRLYNNLEEVQKLKQKKEADQRKMDNQLKKKEYAEKLRRLKKERSDNMKH